MLDRTPAYEDDIFMDSMRKPVVYKNIGELIYWVTENVIGADDVIGSWHEHPELLEKT